MKALFLIPKRHEEFLPTMEKLQYLNRETILCGGWWLASDVSFPVETVMVVVDTTETMIEEMFLNPDYLFLEDIIDATI